MHDVPQTLGQIVRMGEGFRAQLDTILPGTLELLPPPDGIQVVDLGDGTYEVRYNFRLRPDAAQ